MKTISTRLLWAEFASRGIRPLVLRDFEKLPDMVRSDLDLALAEQGLLPGVEQAITAFALAARAEIITVIRRSYVWEFKLLGLHTAEQLVIDVHTEGEGWRGPLYLTAGQLFAAAQDRGAWLEPARHHQAMMAVFQHLLWGRFYKAKYHQLVPRWLEGCEDDFVRDTDAAFGSGWGGRTLGWLRAVDVAALEAAVPALRQALWRTRGIPDLPGCAGRLARFVLGELQLTLARQGRWVVLVGPDGVGKTTVAQRLAEETRPFFRGFRYHHWIPPLTRPLATEVPAGGGKVPHHAPGTGPLAALAGTVRLARNFARAWLGFLLRVLPHLLRQRLVLGDRYHFNYLLDPPSVRYSGPQWLARLALRFSPHPALILRLTAPAEIVHARKKELSLAEIEEFERRAAGIEALGFRVAEISAIGLPEDVAAMASVAAIRTLAVSGEVPLHRGLEAGAH